MRSTKSINNLLVKSFTLVLFLLFQFNMHAQHQELKQKISAFVDAKAGDYDKKYLNETEPDYGELDNTNFDFHDFFILKAKEKTVNNIGNKSKLKLDYSFYAYENEEEKMYALRYWFKNFIGDNRITPGRTMRSYKGAEPTIIVINKTDICVVQMSCKDYSLEFFRELRKEMLTFFGNPESMIIELDCEGPLDWTKNAPDPKDPIWRK